MNPPPRNAPKVLFVLLMIFTTILIVIFIIINTNPEPTTNQTTVEAKLLYSTRITDNTSHDIKIHHEDYFSISYTE